MVTFGFRIDQTISLSSTVNRDSASSLQSLCADTCSNCPVVVAFDLNRLQSLTRQQDETLSSLALPKSGELGIMGNIGNAHQAFQKVDIKSCFPGFINFSFRLRKDLMQTAVDMMGHNLS